MASPIKKTAKNPKGAGRPKGSKTKRVAERALRAAREGMTPVEYLLQVMNESIPSNATPEVKAHMTANKLDAAKAAAPYVHPRLQAIQTLPPADENAFASFAAVAMKATKDNVT